MAHLLLEGLLKGVLEVTVSVAAQAMVTAAMSSTSSEHHHHHHHHHSKPKPVAETARDEARGYHIRSDDSQPKVCPHAYEIEIMTPDEYARQKICIFCSKTYFESKNSSSACIHHHGSFDNGLVQWSCCRRKIKDDTGRHLENATTGQVLREIDVLKYEKQKESHLPPKYTETETPKEGMSGNLIKQGHIVKNWKQRFFKLEKETLRYYSDSSCTKLLGELNLIGCEVSLHVIRENYQERLAIRMYDSSNKKEFIIYGSDKTETTKWFDAILSQVEKLNASMPIVKDFTQNTPKNPVASIKVQAEMDDFVIVPDKYGRVPTESKGIVPPPVYMSTPFAPQQNVNNTVVENQAPLPEPTAPALYPPLSQDGNFIIHQVNERDTLAGLALRYNTSIAVIKRVNRLISSFANIAIPKKYLFIPWDGKTAIPPQEEISEAMKKRRMIKEFMLKSGCLTSEEAWIYLDEASWDFDAALLEYKKDEQWGNANPVSHTM